MQAKRPKKQSIIEEIAYRDTWGKGISSYLAMMYERLKLMHNLLAEDGSIYVHCDHRVNAHMKILIDDIFGSAYYKNDIIWKRTSAHSDSGKYGINTDFIFYYTKSNKYTWNQLYEPYTEEYLERYRNVNEEGRKWTDGPLTAKGLKGVDTITHIRVLQVIGDAL